ncbi:MAG: PilZ domain-containing protein [Nitrospira sp.]
MQELRSQPRFHVNCPVSFVVEDVAGTGVIFNLSEEGCAIESDVCVPQEGYASASLTIPGTSDPVVVDLARVRWVTRHEFGLEFRIISQAARKHIRRYLLLDQAA